MWAAIDLMDGGAVTLVQGNESQKTRWREGPVELARRWQDDGADGLHIVDLDAAFGKGSNKEVILRMLGSVALPVQVGGGVRSREAASAWLESGAARVVLGTLAYEQPAVLGDLLGTYGSRRVVVAADYRDGEVVTRAWKSGGGVSVEKAAEDFEKSGVVNLLTTSVGRDGMGSGPDVEMVRRLARTRKLAIIASGGIRDVGDLEQLRDAGASGAVIGRALYDGGIKLAEARSAMS